jgi:hypothetical protein
MIGSRWPDGFDPQAHGAILKEETMRGKLAQEIRTARVVWTACLKAFGLTGALGGGALGVIVGFCSAVPASLAGAVVAAILSACWGVLLGTAVGAVLGAGLGFVNGGFMIVELAAESVPWRKAPRLTVGSGSPAELIPAEAPQGRGDEASPASVPPAGIRGEE